MNIHGFRDINQRNGQDSRSNIQARRPQRSENNGFFDDLDPLSIQNIQNAQKHKVLFISGNKKMKDPRQQNYFDMLSQLCCPNFALISFSTLVLIATLVMFIVQLSMGLNKSGQFLEVQSQTLLDLGANYAPYIKQGQVYRLFAPIFLHVNFLHFFGNMMAIFMFLTRIQYTCGAWRTVILYLVSGIGGNIFSALIDSENVKAGASTSLYGIIGVIFGYMIINWNGLNLIGPLLKCQLCCASIMIVFFIFFFTVLGSQNVDTFGHLGGFITGLLLSSINQTIILEKYEKIIRIVFFTLFLTEFLICFVVFYARN